MSTILSVNDSRGWVRMGFGILRNGRRSFAIDKVKAETTSCRNGFEEILRWKGEIAMMTPVVEHLAGTCGEENGWRVVGIVPSRVRRFEPDRSEERETPAFTALLPGMNHDGVAASTGKEASAGSRFAES